MNCDRCGQPTNLKPLCQPCDEHVTTQVNTVKQKANVAIKPLVHETRKCGFCYKLLRRCDCGDDDCTELVLFDTCVDCKTKREDKVDPLAKQVGGQHYKDMAIQPIEFTHKNNLNFCQGNIIKYACRYKQKNGKQDLEKVIHYAELLIQLEYSDESKRIN